MFKSSKGLEDRKSLSVTTWCVESFHDMNPNATVIVPIFSLGR